MGMRNMALTVGSIVGTVAAWTVTAAILVGAATIIAFQ
jgi:hypothetical protein